MIARIPLLAPLLALALLSATGPAAAPTAASEYPERIRSALERLRHVCVEHGGKPGPVDAVVTSVDVDGNGKPDFIFDLRKMACTGRPAVFCAGGFCTFEVYTWRAENDWKPLLIASVAEWRTARIGKRPALILTQQGEFCGKPKRKTCTVTYTFADGKMYGKMK